MSPHMKSTLEAEVEELKAALSRSRRECQKLKNGATAGDGDAAKKDDASMQQALMELLGFGDKALELMGELCEKKAAVAAVDARDIRAIATASGVAACAEINQ